MSLILPKYLQEREDFLHYECDEFKKKLNAKIDENQDIREPYFILFKQNFDKENPGIAREAMSIYYDRPPLIVGSMVYWIDNTRGACFLLWTVNHQGGIKFNKEAPKRLGKLLRVSNVKGV